MSFFKQEKTLGEYLKVPDQVGNRLRELAASDPEFVRLFEALTKSTVVATEVKENGWFKIYLPNFEELNQEDKRTFLDNRDALFKYVQNKTHHKGLHADSNRNGSPDGWSIKPPGLEESK